MLRPKGANGGVRPPPLYNGVMDDLLAWRTKFPILGSSTYLISNSLGAMPRGAPEAVQEYTDAWSTEGVRAWQHWWDLPRKVGDEIAPLIGASPGSVSMHLNVTSAEATVASCFDFSGARNRVVYSEMNFPSVSYLYKAQESLGARVYTVPTHDGISVDLEELLDSIDDDTLLVPVSHVLFRSAFIQDAQAIAEKCRKVGAFLVLDLYQSAGVVPVELDKWGVDFAVGGTLKWLCGGPGNAFLYVRPDLAIKLDPRLTGWIADQRPFDFIVNDHIYDDGAYRFMNGTPNIPGLYAARPGLKIVTEIGIENIRNNSRRQTFMMMQMAASRGWHTTAPEDPSWRGGTVAFDLPDAYEISQELIARAVLVDYRPKSGVRVSPHFYTSDDEIQRFFDEVDEMLSSRAHMRHAGKAHMRHAGKVDQG